jgi:hypothetical protein
VCFSTGGAAVKFRIFISEMLKTQGIAPPAKSVSRALLRLIARLGDDLGKISGGRIVAPLTLQSFATPAVEVTLGIGKVRSELGHEPRLPSEKRLKKCGTLLWIESLLLSWTGAGHEICRYSDPC